MSAFPWLTTIGLIPAVGSVLLFLLPGEARRSARQIALVLSLVTLALAVVATAVAFDVSRAGAFQLTEQAAWIPSFGVTYALGVNGVGLIMILLSVILVPLCILAAWHEGKNRPHQFFAWILLAEAFMVGVFAARDVFLFYIFFEAMLIPMYFLIGSFGGPNARHAALKFLIYSLAGGLIMLIGVIALGVQTIVPGSGIAPDAFLIDSLVGIQYSSLTVEMWIFVAFFIAFAVKAPMVPVHTWLADAAEQASLRLTPPELASSPVAFRRPDGTSVFRPRHSTVFSSTLLLEAEDRLLHLAGTRTGPVVDVEVVERVVSKPDREGRVLGADQADALTKIAVSGRVVDVLVGPAGAGKTTAMNALRRSWEKQHGQGSVVGLAPSAVAAQVLGDDLGIAVAGPVPRELAAQTLIVKDLTVIDGDRFPLFPRLTRALRIDDAQPGVAQDDRLPIPQPSLVRAAVLQEIQHRLDA